MIDAAQFRRDFPEFTDSEKYRPATLGVYLNLAGKLLNQTFWGPSAKDPWPTSGTYPALEIFDYGCELFIAHNLALEARAQAEAANGAVPGGSTGPISSKSVDKVSVNYDVQATMEPDAGHWGLTIYGARYLRLLREIGAVGLVVGAGACV